MIRSATLLLPPRRAAALIAALLLLLLSLPLTHRAHAADAPRIEVTRHDDRLSVTIDGDLFTELLFTGHAKPILYPIIGPHGVRMTRQHPIEEAAPGEETDHPHHKSLWFTHGKVNGVDFWLEYDKAGNPDPKKFGRIVQSKILDTSSGPVAHIATTNDWIAPDGQTVLSDTRRLTFAAAPRGRIIDFHITLHASHGDVTFGETKEGTMALRVNPGLQLKGHVAKGHIINANGDADDKAWGKRSAWVDYWAPLEGHVVGIAVFDHPDNPRHPTWWHARDYGLIAANPFGAGDFDKAAKGTGSLKLPAGQSLTFRYRFYFHEGDPTAADVAGIFEDFKKPTP